jgi:ABC-type nickel/cobalt efflux system permease component RcnA
MINRLSTRVLRTAPLLLAMAVSFGRSGAAWAVSTPFGIATPDSSGPAFTGPLGGLFAWVALRQAEFYKTLESSLMGLRGSGHAFALLVGVSFLYGIFHAVGPGHGKAVITSYLLVSRQTVRRGIVIAFAAALMQGLVAIAVVLLAAVVLHVTAVQMTHATDWFEILSYALVTAVGGWLVWTKLFGRGHHHAASEAHHNHPHDDRDHAHHSHEHVHDHGHAHHHHPADEQCDCGHSHVPDPRLLKKPLSVSRAWAATLSVGIRPCSGAIIILVFALSQNLLIAGIGSVLAMSLGTFITVSALATLAVSAKDVALRFVGLESGNAERVMRVVEIGGALIVLLLGLTLLGGALQGGLPA